MVLLLTTSELSDVNVSSKFSEHIEKLEGFKAQAYRDTGGVLTIGFGHAIKPSEVHLRTAVITRDEAVALLHEDTKAAERAVNEHVTIPLSQGQFDALVSFVFNVGERQFRQSTLLRVLNKGRCCAVPDELRRWTRDNGRVVMGLVRRREAEIALYTGAV